MYKLVYFLLILFLEHNKGLEKYCAIASMKKTTFDSPATKEVVKMLEDKTFFLPTQGGMSNNCITLLLCITVCKKQRIHKLSHTQT